MNDRLRLAIGAGFLLLSLAALIVIGNLGGIRPSGQAGRHAPTLPPSPTLTATPRPTPTPGPLIPTLRPDLLVTRDAQTETAPVAGAVPASPTPAEAPAATPLAGPASPTPLPSAPASLAPASPTPTAAPDFLPALAPDSLRARLGVGVPPDSPFFDEAAIRRLGFGWYLNWGTQVHPLLVNGVQFAQMMRVWGNNHRPNRAAIVQVAAANPGALWLIGNEPDVPWQDRTTPEDYARVYHDLYTFIKKLDPSAQVAIGGVSQPTPLRLLYLERALRAYEQTYGEPMPVDAWNVHAFILREELNSWGVSIPPGFGIAQGALYEIEDHDDLEIFRRQILDFRRWMAAHGQRDKPLIVSEYGVLMPEEYGFSPESVATFMQATFDFLLEGRDPEVGFPADDNRLVQRLAWFSFSDLAYPTGDLVDRETGELTSLGQVFADYAARLDDTSRQ